MCFYYKNRIPCKNFNFRISKIKTRKSNLKFKNKNNIILPCYKFKKYDDTDKSYRYRTAIRLSKIRKTIKFHAWLLKFWEQKFPIPLVSIEYLEFSWYFKSYAWITILTKVWKILKRVVLKENPPCLKNWRSNKPIKICKDKS